jgi:LPS export ABC transporter protein LptC/lipopolysaccharide transport protein LptA
MSTWQRKARLLIAISAVAFAVVVAMALRRPAIVPTSAPVTRTDPEAVVESAEGETVRINRDQEEVRIDYDQLLTYPDGSSKLLGVTVTSTKEEDTFVVTSAQAQVDEPQSNIDLQGDVRLKAASGMTARTDRASFKDQEGIVRAEGPVEFTRGRMEGSGVGALYDKNRDLMTLFDQVSVHFAAETKGAVGLDITSRTGELDQRDNIMRFDGDVDGRRGPHVLKADSVVAHLGADETKFEALELRGSSRITGAPDAPAGGLRAMSGRDIDLHYGPDGTTLERALIIGDATIELAGRNGGRTSEISAATIDVRLAPDGSTPISLVARENIELQMPSESGTTTSHICAQTLDAKGTAPAGITAAHFTGKVRFAEQSAKGQGPATCDKGDRVATSGILDVGLRAGFGAVDTATFTQTVRFVSGTTTATAAEMRYSVEKDVLQLSGTEPAFPRPNVRDEATSIDGARIDITLAGPHIDAAGAVKSVLQPDKRKVSGQGGDAPKLPSMLKSDQPVSVTADALSYNRTAARATYTGNVRLWQAETTIKADSIVVDDKSGDLIAGGNPVTTTTVLLQETSDGKKDRSITSAKSKEFKYEEGSRRATYLGEAYANGPQGDLRADRIELYMKTSGEELDRAEAYNSVTLTEPTRKTTGTRMTYFTADERYVVSGTPVTILDNCGRDMSGRTVTWYRNDERITVDGNEQMRARTRGGSQCP